jgi:hypothetical protein
MTVDQIFTVFYAIVWGTLANALPRWKAFDTGRCVKGSPGYPWYKPFLRLLLSVSLLTIIPIIYFAWAFRSLIGVGPPCSRGQLVFAALAAIAPFGFYRLWLAAVQFRSGCFYPEKWDLRWALWFPHLSPAEDLRSESATGNLVFGFVYLLASGWFLSRLF